MDEITMDEITIAQLKNLAFIAKSEMETVENYVGRNVPDEDREKLAEIIGDELNHALVAIFAFARKSGIKIPTDNLDDMTDDVFKVEGDNANA